MASQFWLSALVTLFLAGGTSVALAWFCRSRGWARGLAEGTDDIEGVYVTVLATVYAVVLAFMVFVVWTQFWEALETVQNEAVTLEEVCRLSGAMPTAEARQLERDGHEYAELVAREEWPAMAHGAHSEALNRLLDGMWERILAVSRDESAPEKIREQLMDSFLDLSTLRQERLLRARERLPGVLWALLLVGALVTIGFATLFGGERFSAHALKAAAVTTLITAALTAIVALDHPFRGYCSVDPTPFQAIEDLD